jgi:acyl-CoA synthetase (AMP-forming)/AMP-acid ligase II
MARRRSWHKTSVVRRRGVRIMAIILAAILPPSPTAQSLASECAESGVLRAGRPGGVTRMSDDLVRSRPELLSFIDLLRWRALDQPDRRAITFLRDGELSADHLTYAELDRRARAVGALLQREVPPGTVVLLVCEPGLDYVAGFFGGLYAGVTVVPAYPPHPTRPERMLPKLRAIAADVGPHAVLASPSTVEAMTRMSALAPELASIRWLTPDQAPDERAGEWRQRPSDPDALALLQYTSGSTGAPRGVMLTHANLLANSAMIRARFHHTEDSRGVIWLPPYHDMGLIGGILQPIYAGFPVVLMPPLAVLQRPLRWLQAISRYRATTSGGPNFAYNLCVRMTTPEQRAALDLSTWDVAFNGAEPIQAATLERFAAAFAPSGFRREALFSCYGLAEATLLVTSVEKAAAPRVLTPETIMGEGADTASASPRIESAQPLVGCGQPPADEHILIVHPERLARCRAGETGEIWVSGPNVARGYWNRPAETDATFRAYLADTGADTREGPFLRTGDLGFLLDGELFVTGRLKDLIIIRGRNVAPQDIEATVGQSHPALRPGQGAAFTVEASDDPRLVIVHEVERQYRHLGPDEMVAAIRRAVAEQHDLQVSDVVLLTPGRIPKTTSGKVQRHVCRDRFLAGTLERLVGAVDA